MYSFYSEVLVSRLDTEALIHQFHKCMNINKWTNYENFTNAKYIYFNMKSSMIVEDDLLFPWICNLDIKSSQTSMLTKFIKTTDWLVGPNTFSVTNPVA